MNLAFMGTPAFALPTLHGLLACPGHRVSLVITQPDKPKGRGKHVQPPPVKAAALEYGIPVLQPEKLRQNGELLDTLKQAGLDAVIVVAYGKIIPQEFLEVPRLGFLNVHASLLPSLRGAAPINWAILSGYTETGVSIMRLDEGLDTGPVYLKRVVPIEDADDAETLAAKLAALGAPAILEVLELLDRQAIAPCPQDDALSTYARPLEKEDGLLDWHQDPPTICRQIRALVPWPCAFTRLEEKILRIRKASYRLSDHTVKPGTLLKEEGLKIACPGGYVLPELVQLEGKQVMDVHAFANGLRAQTIMLGE